MITKIKVVVFDQGGVLTRGGGKGTNENAIMKAMGLSELFDINDLLDGLKRGRISNDAFIEEVNRRHPNARTLTNAMWNDVYITLKPEKQAYAFADECRRAGLKVGLLSNINPAIAGKLRRDGSYRSFNPLVLSYEAGYAKPDPEIYELVERQLPGIEPAEILLLDDQKKCTDGASERGWQTLLVKDTQQMIREASRLLNRS